jgi:hypothetical protein
MPKIDKAPSSHRNSVSTASAAGGGTRSSSWSAKDDETLIQARAQGLNWNQISPKHFPQKSANACRKRHERLMERQNAEQWDGVKLDILAQAYMDVRREMWSILAARVGEKWTLVEQKVAHPVSHVHLNCKLISHSAWRRDLRILLKPFGRRRRSKMMVPTTTMKTAALAFLTSMKSRALRTCCLACPKLITPHTQTSTPRNSKGYRASSL